MDWKKRKKWMIHYNASSVSQFKTEAAIGKLSPFRDCTIAANYTWASTDYHSTYTAATDVVTSYINTYHAGASIDNFTFDGISGYVSTMLTGFVAKEETPEEKAARIEMERKYTEEVRQADRVARRYFVRIAGIDKYKMLKRLGHFDVVSTTGQRYRLAVGQKVKVMHGCFGDQVKHQLCAYVPEVPQVDTLVAQYLALRSGEQCEEEFKKIAIKHAA